MNFHLYFLWTTEQIGTRVPSTDATHLKHQIFLIFCSIIPAKKLKNFSAILSVTCKFYYTQIADAIKEVCVVIYPNDEEGRLRCEVMVEQYAPSIIELFVNTYLQPEPVCTLLTLCPWNLGFKLLILWK